MTEDKNVTKKAKSKKQRSLTNKTIRFFISVMLIILVGYGVFNYLPFVAKYDSYVIATGSMAPIINEEILRLLIPRLQLMN